MQRALSSVTPEESWATIPPTAAIRDVGSSGWNGGVEWGNVKDDWRIQFYSAGRSRHTPKTDTSIREHTGSRTEARRYGDWTGRRSLPLSPGSQVPTPGACRITVYFVFSLGEK